MAPWQGVVLSTYVWARSHPHGHIVACFVGYCGNPGTRLGETIHTAGPHTFEVKLYDRAESRPKVDVISVTFDHNAAAPCAPSVWNGGVLGVNAQGRLMVLQAPR